MNSHRAIEEREKARTLPLGHYSRAHAEQRVNEIYSLCRRNEIRWVKKLRKKLHNKAFHPITLSYAAGLVWRICNAVNTKPPRRVVIRSTEKVLGSAGWYNPGTKEIHFPDDYITFTVLIHELTHHFEWVENMGKDDHGPNFVALEDLVFSIAAQVL